MAARRHGGRFLGRFIFFFSAVVILGSLLPLAADWRVVAGQSKEKGLAGAVENAGADEEIVISWDDFQGTKRGREGDKA